MRITTLAGAVDRFIAFIWGTEREDRLLQIAQWETELKSRNPRLVEVFRCDGLAIFALPDSHGALPVCSLDASAGVVIGALFASGDEATGARKRLPPDASNAIIDSYGAELIRDFWGSYVAFLRGRDGKSVHIVRDPCGASACFRTQARGISILCSYVHDVADLTGIYLSIDWGSVGTFLLSNYVINARTGLRELTEILPGQLLTFRAGIPDVATWLWNPIDLSSAPARRSFDEATAEFRAAAERCFEGWMHTSGDTLIRMSGGLDSSIVAGLARQTSSARLAGVHFVGRGYEAFELRLAREMAVHADISLVEQPFDGEKLNFRAAARGLRLARPSKQVLGADADAKLQEVCDTTGCQSVMSGHGGDAVFLQRSLAGDAAVDFLSINGFGAGLPDVIYETAVLLEISVWEVLGNTVAHLLRRRRWEPGGAIRDGSIEAQRAFASETFFEGLPQPIRSQWLNEAQSLPPCKAEQLRNLLALRNYHSVRGHATTRRSIHPLISQPLIELSLRTPAYLFNAGGVDRHLERRAFADLIPASIVQRFHKGFVNHSVIASLVGDLQYIRDLVLNGRCMDSGLLNRPKVEDLLSAERLLEGKALNSVMNLVAVESWLTPWLGR